VLRAEEWWAFFVLTEPPSTAKRSMSAAGSRLYHALACTIEHWYYRALKERTDPVGVLRRKVTPRRIDGADRAEDKLADREIRGYEAEYVGSLWHWDCHHGSAAASG
jgi:hypothetical protein